MPRPITTEALTMEIGAYEPWPNDAKLFQPYDVEQILLPDNANCLAVQAYLKMLNLPYEVIPRANAEFMSPTGGLPFIKCGPFVIAELKQIITFCDHKNVSLTAELDTIEKCDLRAYMSLVNTVLGNAELYVCWADDKTYEQITKPRYGSVFPWPINVMQTYTKRRNVLKQLKSYNYLDKTLDEMYADVHTCCNSLADRLGDSPYFFGKNPTELDALVFGHLFTVVTTKLLDNRFADIVRKFPSLVQLIERIESKYFLRELSEERI